MPLEQHFMFNKSQQFPFYYHKNIQYQHQRTKQSLSIKWKMLGPLVPKVAYFTLHGKTPFHFKNIATHYWFCMKSTLLKNRTDNQEYVNREVPKQLTFVLRILKYLTDYWLNKLSVLSVSPFKRCTILPMRKVLNFWTLR